MQPSAYPDWLQARGLGDATLLATFPNHVMDQLSGEDRVRLSGLLQQAHDYEQAPGFVARWNAAMTRAELTRRLNRK